MLHCTRDNFSTKLTNDVLLVRKNCIFNNFAWEQYSCIE